MFSHPFFQVYGPGYFDVSVTANVILRGTLDGRYSVFFGQDFGVQNPRDYHMSTVQVVSSLADVQNLRTDFGVDDFAEAFLATHTDTSVSVDSLVSVVYLITRVLGHFGGGGDGDDDVNDNPVVRGGGGGGRQRTVY
jgi:hypothetical protein